MLDPHFTLVFPVDAPRDDLVAEARSTATVVTALSFTLRSVHAVRDMFWDIAQ